MTVSRSDFTLIGKDGVICTDIDRLSGIITSAGGPVEQQMSDTFGLPSNTGHFSTLAIMILCYGSPKCVLTPISCRACTDEVVDEMMSGVAGNVRKAVAQTSVDPNIWFDLDSVT